VIIEFDAGADANLLEHELTRDTDGIVVTWTAPGVFRLVGSMEALRPVIEERWAQLPSLPPARLITAR